MTCWTLVRHISAALLLNSTFLSYASSGIKKKNPIPKTHNDCVLSMLKIKKFETKSLEAQLKHLVKESGGYGGAIFRISHAGQLLWEGSEGYIDATKTHPITVRSTFEIASVTKTFTASVILQLVEEGKLKLDDKLRQLLAPSIIEHLLVINHNDYSGEITLRQLLNHTSGLAHFWDDPPYVKKGYNTFFSKFVKDESRIWHPIETLSFVPHLQPNGFPGSVYHYSDTNYVLLGMIIETVEKKPLHEVFRSRIFNKLGLKDTYLSYREKPKSHHQESHRFFEDEDLHGKKEWSADWASGGLVSSTRDLETFILALAKGKFLKSSKTLQLMQTWVETNDTNALYGLGIFGLRLDKHQGTLWGHDGWGGSFMYYWPERDVVFTGTLNQTGSEDDDSENEWWKLIDEAIRVLNSCHVSRH